MYFDVEMCKVGKVGPTPPEICGCVDTYAYVVDRHAREIPWMC